MSWVHLRPSRAVSAAPGEIFDGAYEADELPPHGTTSKTFIH